LRAGRESNYRAIAHTIAAEKEHGSRAAMMAHLHFMLRWTQAGLLRT